MSERRKQTPWAVVCREHGQVFLTDKEYDAQMDDPDALWKCPLCGRQAEWDDDNYEAMARDDDFAEEGTA